MAPARALAAGRPGRAGLDLVARPRGDLRGREPFRGGSPSRRDSVAPLEELLATKLRALFQRRKGRDLFDLWAALDTQPVDAARIVEVFLAYMKAERARVSRKAFEENLAAKVASRAFNEDLRPLLSPGLRYDAAVAAELVRARLLSRL